MKVTLERYSEINYPSGSALEYYQGTLFLIGDDAPYILCLDNDWNEVDRIHLIPQETARIPKPVKHDAECATIIGDVLYVLGSGSLSPYRDVAYIIQLSDKSIKKINTAAFYNLFRDRNLLNEMNIEGFTDCRDKLLFFNRGNTNQPNSLIITDQKILKKQFPDKFKVIPVEIDNYNGVPLGISGAHYLESSDILFLTASAENTNNSYDDGEIIGSVIGIIKAAYSQLNNNLLKVQQLVMLNEIDIIFAKQKIESVCIVSKNENELTCVLVADNDDGKSILFQVKIEIN